VSIIPGNSTEQYAKLIANPDNPPFDVLWLDVDFIAPLAVDNMLLPLEEDDIPNLANVHDNLIFFDRQAVAGNFGAITLVYDSSVVPSVDSWEILWDPSVACNFALSPFDSWALQWLAMADKLAGGDGNDLNNGIEHTKTLAPMARALIGDYDLRPTFERGEVAIGMIYSGEAFVMYDAGQESIRMAKPTEGGVMIPNSLVIPKNAKHPQLAKKFVDYALAQQGQQGFIDDYATVPSNKTIEVSDELAPWMYLGDDVSRLFIPDYTQILAERDAVAERWNAEIVPLVGSNC
jgi:spermidine/putrescine-binding protein